MNPTPAAALLCLSALASGTAHADAYAATYQQGWDQPTDAQSDGPRPGHAESGRAASGSFDTGATYGWLASASAGDRRGDLHALLQSSQGLGFGYLATTSTVLGDVGFDLSEPRVVRFQLDVRGSLQSQTGATRLEAGGSLAFGSALSYLHVAATGLAPSVLPALSSGTAELVESDRDALHLRLTVEQWVQPGGTYALSASLGTALTGYGIDIAAADLDHTAQLSVWLPPGVGMITTGGFLAELPPAVPEPGPAALLASGLVVLALRRAGRVV